MKYSKEAARLYRDLGFVEHAKLIEKEIENE